MLNFAFFDAIILEEALRGRGSNCDSLASAPSRVSLPVASLLLLRLLPRAPGFRIFNSCNNMLWNRVKKNLVFVCKIVITASLFLNQP